MLKGYELRDDGVLKQSQIFDVIKDYNKEYVDQRYNSYGELGLRMAYLRLGYLLAAWESFSSEKLKSVLDVGYGNGDFLKVSADIIEKCYGSDVSGYPVPEKCIYTDSIFDKEYDVVCFFDVLEHFEDIDVIKDLKTKMIVMSVPECHFPENEEWFANWKHRRPDEHLYHFNKDSIVKFFEKNGYTLHTISNVEDAIRKPADPSLSNILSVTFIKK